MAWILDAKQAKEMDRISMEELGMPSLALMERAALGVVREAAGLAEGAGHMERTGATEGAGYTEGTESTERAGRILAVCGSGNNGGDAVAAARILSEWGYNVTVALPGNEEKFSGELKAQVEIARRLDMDIMDGTSPDQSLQAIKSATVILDGIFGIGLSREVTGVYRDWIEAINGASAKVCAIDIPSGIHATTGEVLGVAVRADVTVTFGAGKLGMYLYPGKDYAGEVILEDIGFPREAVRRLSPRYFTYQRGDLQEKFPRRMPRSNKGSYGKLLVVAGSEHMGGAALFAARAACLVGAGLVKVVTHENNRVLLQERLPEALLGIYGTEDYDLAGDLAWASAVVIGPGLGQSDSAQKLLRQVLSERERPVLIDADGLNMLSEQPEYFDRDRRLLLPENFVVTPHLKEMSRLRRCSVEEIQNAPPENVFRYTEGAVTVQKDAVTLVSDGRTLYVNTSGNSALAKGGSGDVLSGVIGGLLARGVPAFSAATLGVYLHGLTAEEYVKERSSSSMLASDILELLPGVLPF